MQRLYTKFHGEIEETRGQFEMKKFSLRWKHEWDVISPLG